MPVDEPPNARALRTRKSDIFAGGGRRTAEQSVRLAFRRLRLRGNMGGNTGLYDASTEEQLAKGRQ